MQAPRAWAMLAAVAVVAVALAGQFRMPLNGDAAYVLDVARRMVGGAVLYRDIIDLNPPFIFWASLPIASLRLDGPSTIVVFKAVVVLVVLGCLAFAWRSARAAPAMLAGFTLMALVLAVGYFGQREHFLLALIFPYLALGASRAEDRSVTRRGAILAGILAGAGIALKPSAALGPALIALQQCRWARSWRPLVSPEHVALAATLVVSAGAVFLFAPDYPAVAAAIQGPYREFNRESLAALLGRDVHMWTVWLALGLAILFGSGLRESRRIRIEALAMLGLFASAVLQGKGFGYHYYPALSVAVLVAIELLAARQETPSRRTPARRIAAVLVLIPVVWLFGAVTWRRAGGVVNQARVDQSVVDRMAGPEATRVAVLSARMLDAYPLVLERGHQVVLAYPQLWAASLPPDRQGTAPIRRRYGTDIRDGRPEVVIVRAPGAGEGALGDIAVNYLEYLCRDSVARAALSLYRLADRAGGFDLYRLDANGPQACASS